MKNGWNPTNVFRRFEVVYVGALFHPLFGASERALRTPPELGLNGPHNASKRQELLRARAEHARTIFAECAE